jgi:hypothetical protein
MSNLDRLWAGEFVKDKHAVALDIQGWKIVAKAGPVRWLFDSRRSGLPCPEWCVPLERKQVIRAQRRYLGPHTKPIRGTRVFKIACKSARGQLFKSEMEDEPSWLVGSPGGF